MRFKLSVEEHPSSVGDLCNLSECQEASQGLRRKLYERTNSALAEGHKWQEIVLIVTTNFYHNLRRIGSPEAS